MNTKQLRQKILDLAIRGKLVPQDPNDEPASVLLERIRTEKERLIKAGKIKRSKNDSVIVHGVDKSHYEQFEIPDSWEWCRLGDICHRFQYGTSQKSDKSGKIAVLRMGNIYNGEIDYSDLVFTSDDSDINKYLLLSNDLLFNRTNSSELVGKTAVYRGDRPALFAGYIIRVKSILINPFYLNLLMNSEHHKSMCSIAKTDGVNQSNINAQKLSNFVYPIAPYSEQCRIVDVIEKAFSIIDKIECDRANLQTIVAAAKSKILFLAIRGKLVPQNPADEPANILLEHIQEERESLIKQGKIKRSKGKNAAQISVDNSYYAELPESWAIGRIGEVFIVNPRNIVVDSDAVSFIPMTLIDDGFSNHFTFQERPWREVKSGFTHFQEGDVGLAKITPCLENRKSVVFRGLINGVGAGTTELHIFRPICENSVEPEYLLWFMKNEHFISECIRAFSGAVGQQRVSKDFVAAATIPIPPLAEQRRIVAAIEAAFEQLDNITSTLT